MKWMARVVFAAFTFIIIAIWTPVGSNVGAIWNSPTQLQEMSIKMDEISAQIEKLSGNDRITRQPDNMSYVKEPVSVGENITLVLFIGRTNSGAGCVLREVIPQFTDEMNVTFPGEPRRPTIQLDTRIVRRIVNLAQPKEITKAGRVRVQMQLEYECGHEPFFEMTKPVFYYALERIGETR